MANEFIFNKNDVAYATSVNKSWEANKSGAKMVSEDRDSFCFEVATSGLKPTYPMTRVAQAIPSKNLKEKFIEKTFYVTVPVKAQKEDLDDFLRKVGDFQVEFREDVGYSIRGAAKMRKGDTIRYRGPKGEFTISFGDKIGGTFEPVKSGGAKGAIEYFKAKCVVKAKPQKEGTIKVKDSRGNTFSFFESPIEDIENAINEMMKAEVTTICRATNFKITLDEVSRGSIRPKGDGTGEYEMIAIAKFLT